jgi:hypothetical protein
MKTTRGKGQKKAGQEVHDPQLDSKSINGCDLQAAKEPYSSTFLVVLDAAL